jgi:hypothetical protein
MHLAQDRGKCRALVTKVFNLLVLQRAENFFSKLVTVSFSRRSLLRGVQLF